jgi:predicted dehydrogenase
MQAGIHVVVEKPMASNVNEAEEMVSTAKKNNVKLCVIHNLLFSPVLQQARKMVDKGTIGDILNIDIKHLCIKDRHLGIKDHWCHDPDWLGGTLHELAPHPLYLARAFLGDISSINAITRKYCDHPWVRADEMEVILKGERGLGSFHISYNSPREFLSLNIIGTGGFIYIDHITQILILRRPRSNNLPGLLMDRLDITLPVLTSTAYGAAYRIRGKIRNRSGHVILIQKFIECMRNDIEPPVTGEDGFKNVTMLDEIWKQVD